MTANPMTHPSPEAVAKAMDYAVVVARDMKRRAARGTHPDMPSETCIDTLAAHVAALTAQLKAERAPIKMVLFCPACGEQHIDAPEPAIGVEPTTGDGGLVPWSNPPHRSHLCHACGHIWRPADVATEGVRAIETVGKADKPLATSLATRLSAEKSRADKAEAEAKALREALKEVVSTFDDLIAESGGVYGLHLNGDNAPWESLIAGGRFEEWTSGLEVARATLAQPAADGGGFKPSAECIAEIEQIHRGQAEAAKAYLANPGAYLVGKDGGQP